MTARRFIPPLSIVLFLALTLAGTLVVRKMVLERHMRTVIEMEDRAGMWMLAGAFPSPVNVKDNDGRTALLWAANEGDNALVARLLDCGADMNARTPGYEVTDRFGDRDCYDNGLTALHLAGRRGHVSVLKVLVARGADVNARAGGHETPLFTAVSWGKTQSVAFLLAHGAAVNAKRSDGMTPLHEAARRDNADMAHILLDHGADMNAVDETKTTPLGRASRHRDGAVEALLRQRGAKEFWWQESPPVTRT